MSTGGATDTGGRRQLYIQLTLTPFALFVAGLCSTSSLIERSVKLERVRVIFATKQYRMLLEFSSARKTEKRVVGRSNKERGVHLAIFRLAALKRRKSMSAYPRGVAAAYP